MRGRRNTTQKEKKKQPPKISRALHICDQNFSSAFALKKHQSPFLSTLRTRQRKRKKWSRLPKVRALCSFPAALFLSFSLSLFCSHAALSSRSYSFSLSFQNAFVRAFVCACLCLERPDLRLGVLFPSQPQVFFSCSHVLTFPLFIIFSFSLLHRRRLRRRTDHGHDRSEVPAHRGNTLNMLFFVRDDDLTQSAGEKETMDSLDLLSRLSRKIAKFV